MPRHGIFQEQGIPDESGVFENNEHAVSERILGLRLKELGLKQKRLSDRRYWKSIKTSEQNVNAALTQVKFTQSYRRDGGTILAHSSERPPQAAYQPGTFQNWQNGEKRAPPFSMKPTNIFVINDKECKQKGQTFVIVRIRLYLLIDTFPYIIFMFLCL